jgi:hypothetical protein
MSGAEWEKGSIHIVPMDLNVSWHWFEPVSSPMRVSATHITETGLLCPVSGAGTFLFTSCFLVQVSPQHGASCFFFTIAELGNPGFITLRYVPGHD